MLLTQKQSVYYEHVFNFDHHPIICDMVREVFLLIPGSQVETQNRIYHSKLLCMQDYPQAYLEA